MERLDFDIPRLVLASHVGVHLVVHLAWETHLEGPRLDRDDGSLAAALRAAAREVACQVLSVGHTEREVHLMVRYPPTVCVSELVTRLKEVSAAGFRLGRRPRRALVWSSGYVARSCDPSRVDARIGWIASLRPEPPDTMGDLVS